MEKTLGGDRLGTGNKQKVWMREYERSTHDLSNVWRSTMAAGTLVPFMKLLALPGDTFDIDLNVDVITHPTIGPLFGTYKVQLDVFECPIRLYQAGLHMNLLGIGLKMSDVKLPQVRVSANNILPVTPPINIDTEQINPSCLLRYLGISGLGVGQDPEDLLVGREFNAIPYLAYFDIYKNYYANKQEGVGAIIHRLPFSLEDVTMTDSVFVRTGQGGVPTSIDIPQSGTAPIEVRWEFGPQVMYITLTGVGNGETVTGEDIRYLIQDAQGLQYQVAGTDIFTNWYWDAANNRLTGTDKVTGNNWPGINETTLLVCNCRLVDAPQFNAAPQVVTFPLENIDTMRIDILQNPYNQKYQINDGSIEPYNLPLQYLQVGDPATYYQCSAQYTQEGLLLKTYQSDLFNNWLDTEWIHGVDGITEITSVTVTNDTFTIDELNLKSKIYVMLNRIAISGGSYDDWLDAVYTHERARTAESPIYQGGLIRNLIFQEVVGTAETANQPLEH